MLYPVKFVVKQRLINDDDNDDDDDELYPMDKSLSSRNNTVY